MQGDPHGVLTSWTAPDPEHIVLVPMMKGWLCKAVLHLQEPVLACHSFLILLLSACLSNHCGDELQPHSHLEEQNVTFLTELEGKQIKAPGSPCVLCLFESSELGVTSSLLLGKTSSPEATCHLQKPKCLLPSHPEGSKVVVNTFVCGVLSLFPPTLHSPEV